MKKIFSAKDVFLQLSDGTRINPAAAVSFTIDDIEDSMKYSTTRGGTMSVPSMNGRERQAEAMRRERENMVREELLESINRRIRLPEFISAGFAMPEFLGTTVERPEEPPRMMEVEVTLDSNGKIIYEKVLENTNSKEKAEAEEKKKKAAYQPGMPIMDFVAKQIEGETDKERLKWLRTFQNCVLPEEVKETIEEALTTVLMSPKFEEWGINESFEKGLTNSILLYGPPGTGKTMIAESFAAVLGKSLLKVTNADLASQIPGESERNITENFKLAKEKDAVLMFDECDSLLYDRNAVGMIMASEINHLLTEIERFDGVCILTTNRLERLDPALQRRIIAKVELPLPNEEARLQIWKNLMPKKAPVDADVDLAMLARLEVSGGEIKNIILTAIRKAIAKNSPTVSSEHFAVACKTVFKAKKDFEDNRPRVISHEDVTGELMSDKVRGKVRTVERVA